MVTYSFNTWNHSAHWGLAPTLPAQIRAASAAGYNYVGLDVPSLRAHELHGLSSSSIGSLLDELRIPCFELVPMSISDDRHHTVEELREVVRLAASVGAQQVLAVISSAIDGRTLQNIERVVDTLAGQGVGVSVEFLPTRNIESIEAVHDIIRRVGRESLRMVIDSWHFFAGPSTWNDLDTLPVDEIGFVQFSDAAPAAGSDVVHEYRHRRVLPGEGVHDVKRFAQTLRERRPDVTVSVEVLSSAWRMSPVDQFAAATLHATRQLWEGP